MDNQIQSILDQAMSPQSSSTDQSASGDPVASILQTAGVSLPHDASVSSGDQTNDPWGKFTQTAAIIAKKRNYPLGVLLGQAALESGRGTSNFARDRNNFFGYEAYDSDPNQAKGYATPADSINDYINLIEQDPRYSWAYQQWLNDKNPTALIGNIRNSGYATDPNYIEKVTNMPEFQNN